MAEHTKTIHIRVSDDFYYELKDKADLSGQSMSAFCRNILQDAKVYERTTKASLDTANQLSKVGNLLKLEIAKNKPSEKQLEPLILELRKLVSELRS